MALARDGVRNMRIIDRAPRGREGPWGTYARMEILRSPKHLTGPDLGFPALTFRAWYEAQHGAEGWERLYKIATADWLAYLLWVRDTAGIAVENGTEAMDIDPGPDFVRVELRGANGAETVYARKVVLAGGRDGSGAPYTPPFPSLARRARSRPRRACSIPPTDIDFARFKGGKVGVLGASASAFDNAAVALEAGAAGGSPVLAARAPAADQQVEMDGVCGLLRRLSPSSTIAGVGDLHLHPLASRRRRRTSRCCAATAIPASPSTSPSPGSTWSRPTDSVTVVTAKARTASTPRSWRPASPSTCRSGPSSPASTTRCCCGPIASGHRRRRDIPMPPAFPISAPASNSSSARRAWLPGLGNIHCFNAGATMSHAALAGDIPGLAFGANRLSRAIASSLFVAGVDELQVALAAHDDRELEPTRYFLPR